MQNVPYELLQEFKDRMHFTHNNEDSNLQKLLSFSISAITDMVGAFDIDENNGAKELVLERTRYAYNDALEYFDKNFASQITRVQLKIALDEIVLEEDTDATI